jgi:hypothetical protein
VPCVHSDERPRYGRRCACGGCSGGVAGGDGTLVDSKLAEVLVHTDSTADSGCEPFEKRRGARLSSDARMPGTGETPNAGTALMRRGDGMMRNTDPWPAARRSYFSGSVQFCQ